MTYTKKKKMTEVIQTMTTTTKMKSIKIIRICILFFMLIHCVNAALTDNIEDYFTFENTLIDSVDNETFAKNSPIYTSNGKINGAYSYNGINDYMYKSSTYRPATTTISFWYNKTSTLSRTYISTRDGVSTGIEIGNSVNNLFFRIEGNTLITTTNPLITNTLQHFVVTWDGTTRIIYMNGVQIINDSYSTVITTGGNLEVGRREYSPIYFDGVIDELSIWNRSLPSSEVLELYNIQKDGLESGQYPFLLNILQFSNITLNEETFTNNSFWMDNTPTFNTYIDNISTNGNVNQTFFLYNSTLDLIESNQFATNNVNGTFTTSTLADEAYYISFYVENNETNVSTGNYTFTIDTTPPVINNNIPSTVESYTFSPNSSCDNIEGGYCNISIDGQNIALNSSTITLTHNGNISYIITAEDLAGNIVTEEGVVFVNPYQYFRFYDTIRSQYVSSYTFENYTSNNTYISIPIYDLGLGNHSLEFVGFGFETQSFNFSFANTSTLNQTFNVSPAILTILAFDETTLEQLTNFNIQIKNNSDIQLYNNINNLTLYSDNFSTLLGDLEITISKNNYTSRVYSLSLDAYSVINLNAYILGTDDGSYVDFFVYDNNNKVVENALISIYQTINGSDTVIEQIYTDGAGYGGVFIDPTKSDQFFLVIKDGFVQQEYDIRPTTSEYKVYLKVLTDVWEPWNSGVSYNVDKHSTNTEPLNITFTITNQNNDFTLWGFKVYDETNTLIDTIQSTANSGGSLSYLDEENHSKLTLTYYYQIGTNTESFSKFYYYHFISYNYSSLNIINMGEDFVQSEEMPNEGKAVLFLIVLIFVIAIPNKIPELKGKGAGLFLGWAIVLLYSYIGGIHWGLSAMAIIGTALIHFDKKTEGRL